MVQIGRKIKKIVMGKRYVSKASAKKTAELPYTVHNERDISTEYSHLKLLADEYLDQLAKSERSYVAPTFIPESHNKYDFSKADIDLLAFYLPQFHPFKENEDWWGKGFTEWTNVTRARPQFKGHYQPHLPSGLGFYDLRVEETMERQIKLAKSHGLSGFIFHHYWFNGHRLMESPLDQFLKNTEWNFKFCLCWANENFTRRWDGSEHEVLLSQNHSPENDSRYIRDAQKYICDKRYFNIDGKPILIIYRPALIPNIEVTIEKWRKIARAEFGKELFLLAALTFDDESDPRARGFDGGIQFPPHSMGAKNISNTVKAFSEDYAGFVYDYQTIPKMMKTKLEAFDFPVIPTVFPSWDNTARQGRKGHVFINSHPDQYADWLAEALNHAINKPVGRRPVVVINAWNEWAEGAHLEPCQKMGYAYLTKTSDTLKIFTNNTVSSTKNHETPFKEVFVSTGNRRSDTAVVIHAYYVDVLEQILNKLPVTVMEDIIITTSEDNVSDIQKLIKNKFNIRARAIVENRGRDVLPFLRTLKFLKLYGYKYFFKIHTKKSKHREDGNVWANTLFDSLIPLMIGNRAQQIFEKNDDAGLIAPFGHVLNGEKFTGSPRNEYWIKKIERHLNLKSREGNYSFIPGTMFAGRVSDFDALSDNDWIQTLFDDEYGQVDGTIAHALERFFGKMLHLNNKKIYCVDLSSNKEAEAIATDCYMFAKATN